MDSYKQMTREELLRYAGNAGEENMVSMKMHEAMFRDLRLYNEETNVWLKQLKNGAFDHLSQEELNARFDRLWTDRFDKYKNHKEK